MSLLDVFTLSGDRRPVVMDIGAAYTKSGFAGEFSPRNIQPSFVKSISTKKLLFDERPYDEQKRLITRFVLQLYYRILCVNTKDRAVILLESVLIPRKLKRMLADIFLRELEVPSLTFIPSHLAALYILNIDTALVIDVGYNETTILPIAFGVPMSVLCQTFSAGAAAIHRQLRELLVSHACVFKSKLQMNTERYVNELEEDVIEDIKVRCCFVTTHEQAEAYKKDEENFNSIAKTIRYNYGEYSISIPGIVRELACETLFNEDSEDLTLTGTMLDSIRQCPIDLRVLLAKNIVVIGGTSMVPGFLHRLRTELLSCLESSSYKECLFLKDIRFHILPVAANYAAWMGAAIFGATEAAEIYATSHAKYNERERVPDWFGYV